MAKYIIKPENYFTFEESSRNNNKIGSIKIDAYTSSDLVENILFTDFAGTAFSGVEVQVIGYKSLSGQRASERNEKYSLKDTGSVEINATQTISSEAFEKGNYGATLTFYTLVRREYQSISNVLLDVGGDGGYPWVYDNAEFNNDYEAYFVDNNKKEIDSANIKFSDLAIVKSVTDPQLVFTEREGYVDISYSAKITPFNTHTFENSGTAKITQKITQYVPVKVFVKISGKNPINEGVKFVFRATSNVNPYGEVYSYNSNELIQKRGSSDGLDFGFIWGDGKNIPQAIATNIFQEFENGKRTATLTWCGSPYIKVWEDTIKVIPKQNYNGKEEELTEYRVHSIQNTFDGGFKQVLKLVEKGEKVYG